MFCLLDDGQRVRGVGSVCHSTGPWSPRDLGFGSSFLTEVLAMSSLFLHIESEGTGLGI